jgi:pimeloyl-ACP methyl ester carboxylesterase
MIAIDLPGYGDEAAWPEGVPYRLSTGAAILRKAIEGRREPVDVVAHSFGAAVALRFALEDQARVKTLTLVEPTLFRLLRDLGPRGRDALRGIERIARAFTPSGPDQDRMFAIARFVDYWNGARTWAGLPSQRQEMLALKSDQVRRDFEAIFSERLCLAAFRKLNVPTLIVTGTESPAAALLVAEGLARVAPRASLVTIAGAGHMLPVTHTPDLLRILQARLGMHASPTLKAA